MSENNVKLNSPASPQIYYPGQPVLLRMIREGAVKYAVTTVVAVGGNVVRAQDPLTGSQRPWYVQSSRNGVAERDDNAVRIPPSQLLMLDEPTAIAELDALNGTAWLPGHGRPSDEVIAAEAAKRAIVIDLFRPTAPINHLIIQPAGSPKLNSFELGELVLVERVGTADALAEWSREIISRVEVEKRVAYVGNRPHYLHKNRALWSNPENGNKPVAWAIYHIDDTEALSRAPEYIRTQEAWDAKVAERKAWLDAKAAAAGIVPAAAPKRNVIAPATAATLPIGLHNDAITAAKETGTFVLYGQLSAYPDVMPGISMVNSDTSPAVQLRFKSMDGKVITVTRINADVARTLVGQLTEAANRADVAYAAFEVAQAVSAGVDIPTAPEDTDPDELEDGLTPQEIAFLLTGPLDSVTFTPTAAVDGDDSGFVPTEVHDTDTVDAIREKLNVMVDSIEAAIGEERYEQEPERVDADEIA